MLISRMVFVDVLTERDCDVSFCSRQVQFSLHCQKETAVESLSLTIKMTTGTCEYNGQYNYYSP